MSNEKMEKPEEKNLHRQTQVVGVFTKAELARILLNLAPHVTDWSHFRAQIVAAKAPTIDRIKTLEDADKKERPNKKKTGPKSKRPAKYTADEWRKFKQRERAARHRAKQKQLKKERTQ